MSQRRAALIERFRARARERVAASRSALEGAARPEADAWSELLGGLHTIKGEARMLGLGSLAQVVHAIEERIHGTGAAWPPPGRAGVVEALEGLDAMLLAPELVEDDDARALAEASVAALAQTDASSVVAPARGPAPVLAGTAPTAVVAGARGSRARSVIDVRIAQLDAVCDAIDEIRSQLSRIVGSERIDRSALDELMTRVERLATDSGELRLGPIEPLLAELAAHARELAAQHRKEVTVEVDAGGAALERGVLDALAEPLIHLVRNAVDHGVRPARPGRIVLSAAARSGGVVLQVRDDGEGIDGDALRRVAVARGVLDAPAAAALSDRDAIDLVFRAGLSTRTIASDVSGRGVGLDVVRRVVESLGGTASVASEPGRGTRFELEVPVGLTRERVLVVRAGDLLVGIPARHVVAVVTLAERVEDVAGGRAVRLPEGLVPLRSLPGALGLGAETEHERHAIVLDIGDQRWALTVPAILGDQDVLRRPADRALSAMGIAAASSVLDDGRPVLLPAPADLVRRAIGRGHARRAPAAPRGPSRTRRALVVDDSPIVRELLAERLASSGFEIAQAEDGEAALAVTASRPFDVVVTDVEMPRVDGFELVRRLRARGVRTPVVVVTTRGSLEDRQRAAESGADAYVVKTDFREGDLVEVVRGLVEVAR